jgi:phage-related protein
VTYQLRFGSYDLPSGITVAQVPMARRVPSANTPRYDGARTLTGQLDLKAFSLKGGIFWPLGSTDRTWLRGQLDTLKGALGGGPQNFTTDSDRYYRQCQSRAYTDDYEATGFNRLVNISFEIVTGDPFSYETAAQSAARVLTIAGQTQAAVNAGNAPAAPSIALTVGSAGTLAATITNQTTGDVFTLAGAVTFGDIITIDGLLQSVTRSGVDVMTLFDGQFPRLAVGSNTFLFAWTSSSFSHVTIAWNNRWF